MKNEKDFKQATIEYLHSDTDFPVLGNESKQKSLHPYSVSLKEDRSKDFTEKRNSNNKKRLKVTSCFFGKECRFVCISGGEWNNIGHKICKHIHPGETKENFLLRIKKKQDIKKISTDNYENILQVKSEFTTQAIALAIKSGQDIKIKVI